MDDGYYKVVADDANECWHVYGPPGSTGATEDTEGEERAWLATFHDGEALARFLRAGRQTCACTLAEPCRRSCTCAQPLLSGGCDRCATYGSPEQQRGMAALVAARTRAADALAESDPIEAEDEDEGHRRRVWCQWCDVAMLADDYFGHGEKQGDNYPHEDDCAWVLARGGREA